MPKTPKSTKTKKDAQPEDEKSGKAKRPQSGWRETIESVVVAFILAFLFRTFEAEAFVIPTGSMAPTLYGRHKSCACEQCGFTFTFGASEEIPKESGHYEPLSRIHTAFCPNCSWENNVKDLPVFKGDRILVNKFPFEVSTPKRFDVIVFKFPEDPKTNYIKRLVGLPGDRLKIERGDLFRAVDSGNGQETFEILRKDDPNKARQLQLVVHDDRYRPKLLNDKGWPQRWAGMSYDADAVAPSIAGWVENPNAWSAGEDSSFKLAASNKLQWLRYRHFIPKSETWREAKADPPRWEPLPQLIADACGYNGTASEEIGTYWVGDLTICGKLNVGEVSDGSIIEFELTEGGRWYRCQIKPATGDVRLYYVDAELPKEPFEEEVSVGKCDLDGAGEYNFEFCNIDDRLSLWIDGDLVEFDKPTTVEHPNRWHLGPTDRDLTPVAIGGEAVQLEVSDLVIKRDIYYRADGVGGFHGNRGPNEAGSVWNLLSGLLHDPAGWSLRYQEGSDEREQNFGPAIYDLAKHADKPHMDEFMVLGDNSPKSQDSRLWLGQESDRGWRPSGIREHRNDGSNIYSVPRKALIGKAFFIYWPHGVPFLNDGQGFGVGWHWDGEKRDSSYPAYRIPFYPQFTRMKRIR